MEQFIKETMDRFDISANGFVTVAPLSMNVPIELMSYHNLCKRMHVVNSEKKIQEEVDSLPEFPLECLKTVDDYKLSYTMLTFISHSYIWNNTHTINKLVAKLAVPWWHVSHHIGIKPVLTHASVDLFNWELLDANGEIIVENLRTMYSFTGTRDEEWFYMITTDIEKTGAKLLCDSIKLMYLKDNDLLVLEELVQFCNNLKDTVEKIKNTIARLYENCRPEYFYGKLRTFLGGWSKSDKLPNGLIYEGINNEVPIEYYGGSAAQSTLIQFIDILLGLEHADTYFKDIREYMPRAHREFLEFAHLNINLKSIITNTNNDELKQLYDSAVDNLLSFRKHHIAIIHSYIFQMIQKAHPDVNIDEIKGTGGTFMCEFLKQSRDETQCCRFESPQ